MNSELRKKTVGRGETCSAKRTHRAASPRPQSRQAALCPMWLRRRRACGLKPARQLSNQEPPGTNHGSTSSPLAQNLSGRTKPFCRKSNAAKAKGQDRHTMFPVRALGGWACVVRLGRLDASAAGGIARSLTAGGSGPTVGPQPCGLANRRGSVAQAAGGLTRAASRWSSGAGVATRLFM